MCKSNIRNFCIIAHIDHGKSTLADRLLEYTSTVVKKKMKDQILDDMDLERERGITIKAKTVRMDYYKYENNKKYVLNLIDTPGHIDFTHEVSRALSACEGAILVVDATQGVEAQTLVNAALAKKAKLKIIPVINKIDLPTADIDRTREQIKEYLKIDMVPIPISAKEGNGTEKIIDSIIVNVPPPTIICESQLSALIFDSFYNSYRGIVVIVRIFDGEIKRNIKVKFITSGIECEIIEVGYMKMKMIEADKLSAGEVGYIIVKIKDIHNIKIGDTITECINPTRFIHTACRETNQFVFAGLYSDSTSKYNDLKTALEKLRLSDPSIIYSPETSATLGFGFRCGFLGSLHLEIIKERLEREFGLNLLVTAPSVIYKIKLKNKNELISIDNPIKFPNRFDIKETWEPYIEATIVCPVNCLGLVIKLCQERRGTKVYMKYIDIRTVVLKYHMPLAEIIMDFYDTLKSISKGYASFNYKHIDYYISDLVKLEIMVNSKIIDAFTIITPKSKALFMAHYISKKLKNIIPKHMFEIPIQVMVNNRIISRETIPAMRKDVLAKCYGGDITRKRKLLEKQSIGKRKMKQFGKVDVPFEAFVAILKIHEN
ncbi:MAG: translation elongation factor 4 [Endomicrobium sp.]|jgi:GTP-binding protein LepA|nr:translation elongation factor 4 [Endomicrobium sp.]